MNEERMGATENILSQLQGRGGGVIPDSRRGLQQSHLVECGSVVLREMRLAVIHFTLFCFEIWLSVRA
jgi:hypothetical protein